MQLELATVINNQAIADQIYKMTLHGDFVAKITAPGQFINILVGQGFEHLLRRPISIAQVDREDSTIDIIYRVAGKGTKLLSLIKPQQQLDIIAPLGNGYDINSLNPGDSALLIGGGIGIPPLFELSRQFKQRNIKTTHVLGFNNAAAVFYEPEFAALGDTFITTIDGSYGTKGVVTDLIKQLLEQQTFNKFYTCGPVAMLKAVEQCLEIPGYISLENRMACGVGACYACVCQHQPNAPSGKLYSRVCYEGPVFKSGEVILD